MLVDARTIAPRSELATDVAIVGAGPAGILIAERLAGSGLSSVLLEAGGVEPSRHAQQALRGDLAGQPHWPLASSRVRMFGGAGNRWGGLCRPLDPIDFETRDWVDASGWPIRAEEVERYRADTAAALELRTASFDPTDWPDRPTPSLPLDGGDFANTLVQYSPAVRFGDQHRSAIAGAARLTCLFEATVVDLRLDPVTNRVGRVVVRTGDGDPLDIRARVVILAAGAVENARLLLAARNDRPAGLGNERDLVGRYFMEHLHVPVGHVAVDAGTADRAFYGLASGTSGAARGMLVATERAQRERRLLGCSISVHGATYPYGQPFLRFPAAVTTGAERLYRAVTHGGAAPTAHVARGLARQSFYAAVSVRHQRTARSARQRAAETGVRPVAVHSLYLRSEQVPNPASRVRLGSRRDRCGLPEPRLEWRLAGQDLASVEGWLARLDADLSARRLGRLIPPGDDWPRRILGGPHHMGTTRMSAGPSTGVVDRDCRVHSVANLYLAGSSVFATGGHANPTFTLVALALRLADRVRAELV